MQRAERIAAITYNTPVRGKTTLARSLPSHRTLVPGAHAHGVVLMDRAAAPTRDLWGETIVGEQNHSVECGQRKHLLLFLYADADQAGALIQRLAGESHEIVSCALPGPIERLLDGLQPALVLLSPPHDGGHLLETCGSLRDKTTRPIVVLSENREELLITRALAAGIDEDLVLPIGERELAARIQAMLRRLDPPVGDSETRRAGDLILSSSSLSVESSGRRILLSPMEFRLLSCLASAPGKVFTHEALMSRVWGAEYVDSRQYLHLYIRYLREKLEEDPGNPRLIINEWGIGYRLESGE
jgi:DNA-binding response OmpR family regulator